MMGQVEIDPMSSSPPDTAASKKGNNMSRLPVRLCMLTLILLTSGCETLIFNPVAGPLAAQVPRPVYKSTFALSPNEGTQIVLSLENGQTFQGKLRLLDPTAPGSASQPEMERAWDFVYGYGYYRAVVLGSSEATRAVLAGPADSTLVLELMLDDRVWGVARDSHSNVYKVTMEQQ